ncbi:MAG: DUF1080 domain-containing protein [Pedosphaera sp.]|nr:DUF1080 domain-containing protein [Pedosphaera sp.]
MKLHILRSLTKVTLLAAVLCASVATVWAAPKRVLVVSTTTGFRHSSIPTAQKILKALGEQDGGFSVVDVVDGGERPKDKSKEAAWLTSVTDLLALKLTATSLKNYDAVIFANTTGDLPMTNPQDLIDYVNRGGALIGMHSASDTFHGFKPYVEMLGGEFLTHGAQATVECLNQDHAHPATRHFTESFVVHDEIYIQKSFNRQRVHGLLSLDKHPNTGAPGDYPIAWCKQVGKGRVFYTSLGHREDVWENQSYQKHITGGIRWAVGLSSGDVAPQDLRAELSGAERKEGFKLLFDGVSLNGWHLRNAAGTKSWSAQNGMLVNEIAKDSHGTDLVSDSTFKDFTVRYQYMVPKGSNSGLYLRGRHEIQILEDFGVADLSPGNNGGIYSIKAPPRNVSRRAGEWQEAEATIKGNKVTVTLNGLKIHDNVEVNKATGSELDNKLDQPGSIMLQGDHGMIAFRNVRIKALK